MSAEKNKPRVNDEQSIPEEGLDFNDQPGLKGKAIEFMGLPYDLGVEVLNGKKFVGAGGATDEDDRNTR